MSNSTLRDSPGELVRVEGGHVFLENVVLHNASGNGIRAQDAGLRIHNTTWNEIHGYGVHADRSDSVIVAARSLATQDYGVRVHGGTIDVAHGVFQQACGVYIERAIGRIHNTTFDTAGHGVTAVHAELDVRDATFVGAGDGVLLTGGNATLHNVRAHGVGTGVVVFGDARITGSALHATRYAIDVAGDHDVHIQGNDLTGGQAALRNRAALLDAPENWWGANPPSSDAFEGPVNPEPWRTAPVH